MLSGLRRGELFALRWRDLEEQDRVLMVREAVYEGCFATPKASTSRSCRSSQPMRTASTSWRAEASITAGAYITDRDLVPGRPTGGTPRASMLPLTLRSSSG